MTLLNEMLPQAGRQSRHWTPSCFDTFLADKTGLPLFSQLLADLFVDIQVQIHKYVVTEFYTAQSLSANTVDSPPGNVLFLLSPSQSLASWGGARPFPSSPTLAACKQPHCDVK